MSNKYNYSGKNKFDLKSKIEDIHIGEVVSVNDPKDMGRIKVRIKGLDDSITNVNDLPWSFPMLPKFIGITPQVNEAVMVFIFDRSLKYSDRLFIGPIISQLPNLDFDPLYFSALGGFSFGSQEPRIAPSTIPNAKGVYADKKYFSLEGRDNTDIIFKNGEVVLRAGKFTKKLKKKKNPNEPNVDETEKDGLDFEFNTNSQGYIQIKHDAILGVNSNNEQEKGSVTNIIGNKINLLTYNGDQKFDLANQDDLLSKEELLKILKEGKSAIFGEYVIEYLILLENALFSHVHNGSGSVPTDLTTGKVLAVAEFKKKCADLRSRMLSKNIKIN